MLQGRRRIYATEETILQTIAQESALPRSINNREIERQIKLTSSKRASSVYLMKARDHSITQI